MAKSFEQSAASANQLRKQIKKMQINKELSQTQNQSKSKSQDEQRVMALAYRDPLTNLPNKNLFCDRLNTSISTSRRTGEIVVVVLVDLNNLKEINHSLGHSLGNQILVEAANRLVSCMRDYDTVARIGEDKFLLLLKILNIITNYFQLLTE